MRVAPFSFIREAAPDDAAAGFPDQSLSTWTTTEADAWIDYGAANLNTTTFAYSGSTQRIGSDYGSGNAKWMGGSLADNGKIYAAPHLGYTGGKKWAIIDTDTDSISVSAQVVNGDNQGSVFDKISGKVIAFGNNGTTITVSSDSGSNITSGPNNRSCNPIQSFAGDEIYTCTFVIASAAVYKFNVSTGATTTVTTSGDSLLTQGEFGTLGIDGKMYMPSVSSGGSIMQFDPSTNVNTNIALPGGAGEIYTNIVQHYNGYLYFLPQSAFGTIRWYDPSTDSWIGDSDGGSGFQVGNACIGLDGKIYMVSGSDSTYTLKVFDPATNTHSTIAIADSDSSFQGITVGKNGDLYLIPWNNNYFHKLELVTGTGTTATDIVTQYNFGGRLCWP